MKLDKELERSLVDEDEKNFKIGFATIMLIVSALVITHEFIPESWDAWYHFTTHGVLLVSWILFLLVRRK